LQASHRFSFSAYLRRIPFAVFLFLQGFEKIDPRPCLWFDVRGVAAWFFLFLPFSKHHESFQASTFPGLKGLMIRFKKPRFSGRPLPLTLESAHYCEFGYSSSSFPLPLIKLISHFFGSSI